MIKIGFIGTGLMGLPMAKNILKAGYNLKAFNRSQNKAAPLKDQGAEISSSIKEAVSDSDVVITMLTDDTAVDEIMSSSDFLESLKSESIVIDMSSVKPSTATKHGNNLKSKKVNYLDAPVSGGTIGAEEASLAIMVGGEEKVFLETKKILGAMGRPVLVGPTGAGQLAKLANQAIVGITISAVAEAVLLLERGGANLDSVRDALSGGFADSAILQQHGQRMSKRNFESGGSVRTQLKDLQNIQKVAQILGLQLPMVNKVTERYSALSANSLNLGKDHSALFLELLDRNKITD